MKFLEYLSDTRSYYVSPFKEVGTCWFTFVCSVCPLSLCLRVLSCRRWNTRRGPNAGLMLAHRLRRWANISTVLGYCVAFGVTQNVGQRHRRRANINPALFQSIVLNSRQYVGVTCISPMPGHCVRRWPTFKRHWGGVCYMHAMSPAWILTGTEWILTSPALCNWDGVYSDRACLGFSQKFHVIIENIFFFKTMRLRSGSISGH